MASASASTNSTEIARTVPWAPLGSFLPLKERITGSTSSAEGICSEAEDPATASRKYTIHSRGGGIVASTSRHKMFPPYHYRHRCQTSQPESRYSKTCAHPNAKRPPAIPPTH